MMIKYESSLLKPYKNMFISNSEENKEPLHYSAYFVLLHFYHDAKKWEKKKKIPTETMSWIKKRSIFTLRTHHLKGSPWIHPYVQTHCTDLTQDYGNLRLYNKTLMEQMESAHMYM